MIFTLFGVFIIMKVLSIIFIVSGIFLSIIYRDITILFTLHILAYSVIYVGYKICTDQLISHMIGLESDKERSQCLGELTQLSCRFKNLIMMFTRFNYVIIWLPVIRFYPNWSQLGILILYVCETVIINYTYSNFVDKLLMVDNMIRFNIFNKI